MNPCPYDPDRIPLIKEGHYGDGLLTFMKSWKKA